MNTSSTLKYSLLYIILLCTVKSNAQQEWVKFTNESEKTICDVKKSSDKEKGFFVEKDDTSELLISPMIVDSFSYTNVSNSNYILFSKYKFGHDSSFFTKTYSGQYSIYKDLATNELFVEYADSVFYSLKNEKDNIRGLLNRSTGKEKPIFKWLPINKRSIIRHEEYILNKRLKYPRPYIGFVVNYGFQSYKIDVRETVIVENDFFKHYSPDQDFVSNKIGGQLTLKLPLLNVSDMFMNFDLGYDYEVVNYYFEDESFNINSSKSENHFGRADFSISKYLLSRKTPIYIGTGLNFNFLLKEKTELFKYTQTSENIYDLETEEGQFNYNSTGIYFKIGSELSFSPNFGTSIELLFGKQFNKFVNSEFVNLRLGLFI